MPYHCLMISQSYFMKGQITLKIWYQTLKMSISKPYPTHFKLLIEYENTDKTLYFLVFLSPIILFYHLITWNPQITTKQKIFLIKNVRSEPSFMESEHKSHKTHFFFENCIFARIFTFFLRETINIYHFKLKLCIQNNL
jgi:hypothetical protein